MTKQITREKHCKQQKAKKKNENETEKKMKTKMCSAFTLFCLIKLNVFQKRSLIKFRAFVKFVGNETETDVEVFCFFLFVLIRVTGFNFISVNMSL